jgi:hypothetical protein
VYSFLCSGRFLKRAPFLVFPSLHLAPMILRVPHPSFVRVGYYDLSTALLFSSLLVSRISNLHFPISLFAFFSLVSDFPFSISNFKFRLFAL